MSSTVNIRPIGVVRSTRLDVRDDNWDSEHSHIELDSSQFTEEALYGLSEFSHVEVLFHMNQVTSTESGARHPRGNAAWPKVGIFAQRAKNRPNAIGLTICKIEKVVGLQLWLSGLDAVDGTPVLDLKPWVKEFGPRGTVSQPSWISELMKGYWT